MTNSEMTLEKAMELIQSLPFTEFKKVVKSYSDTNGVSFDNELDKMVTVSLQKRLIDLGVNSTCPNCGSAHISKNGKRKNVQRLECKDCGKQFTPFTDTILEKSKWHWDIWIKVLEMIINNYPIEAMVRVLVDDYDCVGINYKTVWMWRMKLIHALASLPQPTLTGVIQVDETFIRESQKGSRELISYVHKESKRLPRYGRKPSKYGVMGSEFATIVTAIDNRGYSVCKVTSLGRVTIEMFHDLFDENFDSPAYICSDANDIYENYCAVHNIPHYEKPSNYLDTLEKNGYITPDFSDEALAIAVKENNDKILEKLYNEGEIDKITNRGQIKYKDFVELKKKNNLSLARVNELHSDIKRYINHEMTNVSTKYLQDYIGFFTYIRNWRVKHGHYPNSAKDTESIFIEILKTKVNYTSIEIENTQLELPKPTGRYMQLLKSETEKAREATKNRYFKFGEEDGVKAFNKREYLLDLSRNKLYAIAKECGMKRYRQLSIWSLVSAIMKQDNIDQIIYKLLAEDRHYKIDQEDLEAMSSKSIA
ncbi:MAG: IS1 family transposase [Erysipelotrichaceae bacterium]|nr:IS1 family transposase [Erysipelotrichaceae bacterium]